jgi:D-aminopeptidase
MGRPRGRGLGLPFAGTPGPLNAITDVPGVAVGYTSLVSGSGKLRVGQGPVRTGVTALLPRGRDGITRPVWAGMFSLNGNGEMTGTHWIHEAGYFIGPVLITNTHSVGMAHHAAVRWLTRDGDGTIGGYRWALPVVAETCDAYLNDINGLHVTEGHVLAALDGAAGGAIAEGNVGGGVGMMCYEFKGGTGTASRVVRHGGRSHTVGALVQANHGLRPWLGVLGVPVGRHLTEGRTRAAESGSIIAVVGTDLPLLPVQLQRLARRISIGVGRGGTPSGDGSGDLFLAFSTANDDAQADAAGLLRHDYIANQALDPVFLATVEAVEEAVINAMIAAETMTGVDDHRVLAIDHAALRDVMRRYGRLEA